MDEADDNSLADVIFLLRQNDGLTLTTQIQIHTNFKIYTILFSTIFFN